jgi:hypothetical protein
MARHSVGHWGTKYEAYARNLLVRIASMVQVPREEDFGIDFYCQPLVGEGKMQDVKELCVIQVKGGKKPLAYGGLHPKTRKWRGYHFDWLRSLGVPLYLVKIDNQFTKAEVFSLWPVWLSLWNYGVPFKINVITRSAMDEPYQLEGTAKGNIDPKGEGFGNGCICQVNVGTPFLELNDSNLRDPGFCELAMRILRKRISIDQQSLMWFRLGVPGTHQIDRWQTNNNNVSLQRIVLFNPTPGMNIRATAQAAEAVVTALGYNLKEQNNPGVFSLVPFLRWLSDVEILGGLGSQLLDTLEDEKPFSYAPSQMPPQIDDY